MAEKGFDPSRYLTKVGSSDYLEVKWRLVWLRELHPDAIIETDLHSQGDQVATFKARVSIPGGGSATGWASETYGDFRDFLEKAETKALGRALAALGFGTQFTGDFEAGPADAPVDRSRGQGATNAPREQVNRETGEITRSGGASDKQINYIFALGKQRGYAIVSDDRKEHAHEEQCIAAINRELGTNYGSVREMTGNAARAILDRWAPPKEDRQQQSSAPTPIRQAAPESDETAWTEFWKWARLNGVSNPSAFTNLTQRFIKDFTPQAARSFLEETLTKMPAPGTAGNDRFTS